MKTDEVNEMAAPIYSDGIISALSSDPHTPTFNRNSTCLTFQKENTFMFSYNPFLFLFRLSKSNFKNITPSNRYLQHNSGMSNS